MLLHFHTNWNIFFFTSFHSLHKATSIAYQGIEFLILLSKYNLTRFFYNIFILSYLLHTTTRQLALDVKRQKELTQKEELAYYREQEQVVSAEQERRHIIANEEKRINEQRRK